MQRGHRSDGQADRIRTYRESLGMGKRQKGYQPKMLGTVFPGKV